MGHGRDSGLRIAPEGGGEAVNAAVVADAVLVPLLIHLEAEAVVMAAVGEHGLQRFRLEQAGRVERLAPSQEVVSRRIEGAGGEGDAHVEEGGVAPNSIRPALITLGPAWDDRPRPAEPRKNKLELD